MTRVLGFFGLAGIFFIISPGIRQNLRDGIESLGKQFDSYAPYSYLAGVLALLLLLMMSLYRGAQPR